MVTAGLASIARRVAPRPQHTAARTRCAGEGSVQRAFSVCMSSRLFGVAAALVTTLSLLGCANNDYDTSGAWFSKPLDLFGSRGGYSFSQLGANKRERPITANDLVDANGSCAAPAAPGAPPAGGPGAPPAAAADTSSLLGAGVGIGMSECDIVWRVGQPSAVNLGKTPNGERTAVLTFNSGPRPGIYRFVGGRLTEMDRAAEPASPPEEAKTPAKSAKTKKPPRPSGDT